MPDVIPGHAPLRGVIPVLSTPFLDDGTVDRRSFVRAADHSFGLGVRAVMYPGFASEHYALTDVEKIELTGLLLDRARGAGVALVAAVSEYSTDIAVVRARELAELGVDAINVVPTPAATNSEDLMAMFRDAALAASGVPIVVQYVPDQMKTALSVELVRDLAADVGNIAAMKIESMPSVPMIRELRAACPQVAALIGNAGIELLPALQAGAVAVQPGGGFIDIYVEIMRHYEAGDIDAATALWSRLVPYLEAWHGLGPGVGKIISFRRGLMSSPRTRRPAPAISVRTHAEIDAFMAEFADFWPSSAGGPEERR